jgi:hypothetical protein
MKTVWSMDMDIDMDMDMDMNMNMNMDMDMETVRKMYMNWCLRANSSQTRIGLWTFI